LHNRCAIPCLPGYIADLRAAGEDVHELERRVQENERIIKERTQTAKKEMPVENERIVERVVEKEIIPNDYIVEYLRICDKNQVDNVATGYLNHVFWMGRHENHDREYSIARDDQKKSRVLVWNKSDNVLAAIDYSRFLHDGASAPDLIAYLNNELRKIGIDPSKLRVSFAEEHVCRQ
jgi:hypothetical protein